MISVFWPRTPHNDEDDEYVCYGWTEPAICVAALLRGDKTMIDDALLAHTPSWQAVKHSCTGDPKPIGTCSFGACALPGRLRLWHLEEEEFTYIVYDPHTPKSLRFYTLHAPVPAQARAEVATDHYAALAQYDFTHPHDALTRPKALLDETVVNQMNAASFVQSLLSSSGKTTTPQQLLPATAIFLLSLASSSTTSTFSSLVLSLYNIFTGITNFHLYTYTEDRGKQGKVKVNVRLKDVSATVQHIDVRISQARFFVTQVSTLQRKDIAHVAQYAWRYTNFFNTAWLILNDITLGIALGSYVIDNSEQLTRVINGFVRTYLFTYPRHILAWLDAWPAGLKLNAELSAFYVNVLVRVLDVWEASLPPIPSSLIKFIGSLAAPLSSSPFTLFPLLLSLLLPASLGLGLTLLLSLLSDLVTLFLTAHLRVGYELTRVVYRLAGVRVGGGLLLGVFRGKRQNALRQNRTDTFKYDLDQLLFGTVVFTLLAFLWPTILVYYVFFALTRFLTLLFQASLETLLALLYHFPLFLLMLRVKDPGRLAGGVYFVLRPPRVIKVKAKSTRGNDPVLHVPGYLSLESQPIPFSAMFIQYAQLSQRLFTHYNPLRLLWLVLKGEHVRSIGRFHDSSLGDGGNGYGFGSAVDASVQDREEGEKDKEGEKAKEKVE